MCRQIDSLCSCKQPLNITAVAYYTRACTLQHLRMGTTGQIFTLAIATWYAAGVHELYTVLHCALSCYSCKSSILLLHGLIWFDSKSACSERLFHGMLR
jgi:hypothetical protein